MKTFNAHDYVEQKYSSVIELYEEDYGLNGMDLLWSCASEAEVDNLLESYLD